MSKYDIFEFPVGIRATRENGLQKVLWVNIKLATEGEFYSLAFFTEENIVKLKEAIEKYEL